MDVALARLKLTRRELVGPIIGLLAVAASLISGMELARANWVFGLAAPVTCAGLAALLILPLRLIASVYVASFAVPLVAQHLDGISIHFLAAPLVLGVTALRAHAEGSLSAPRREATVFSAGIVAIATLGVVTGAAGDLSLELRALAVVGIYVATMLWAAAMFGGTVVDTALKMIALVGAVLAALSIAHLLFGFPLPLGVSSAGPDSEVLDAGTFSRYGGLFGDYELWAEYLAIVGTLQVWQIIRARNWPWRLVWFAALPIDLVALALTGTRGGLIQLVIGGLIVAIVAAPTVWMRLGAGAGAGIGAALIVWILPYLPGSLSARVTLLYTISQSTDSLGVLLDRQGVWQHWLAAADSLYGFSLFGVGPYYPYSVFGGYPHSLWLISAFSVGLAGLALMVLFLSWAGIGLARRAFVTRTIDVALLAVLVGLVASETKIEFVRLPSYGLLLMAILGMIVGRLGPRAGSKAQSHIQPPAEASHQGLSAKSS
jgi:hypothetical protein